MEFIETPIFTKCIKDLLTDEEYRSLQIYLVKDPQIGKLIPGARGLRKMRWFTRGKGKKGGIRVIYYLYLKDQKIYMLFPYKKNEQEDLTLEQTKFLINFVKEGVL